jgi:hypothetical protein
MKTKKNKGGDKTQVQNGGLTKVQGGVIPLIPYNYGGTDGSILTYVEDIAGTIIWTINSVLSSVNVITDVVLLPSNMNTAWGPNVPQAIR